MRELVLLAGFSCFIFGLMWVSIVAITHKSSSQEVEPTNE
jgi:hypothetical protein